MWIKAYIMMLFAGISGIILCYFGAEYIAERDNSAIKLVAEIGKYTFAIYMMQGVLCQIANYLHYVIFNQFILFTIAVIVFIFLFGVIHFLSEFKMPSKYLLGKNN